MKELYTDKAKQVLKYAKKISKSLGHSYTGTEHILLGLIRQKESLAGTVLEGFQVDENKVLDYIDRYYGKIAIPGSHYMTTLTREEKEDVLERIPKGAKSATSTRQYAQLHRPKPIVPRQSAKKSKNPEN